MVVPTRDRTKRNKATYQALTLSENLDENETAWPKPKQTCTIGPRLNVCNKLGRTTPASGALDSLLESDRVQQNEEPFNLHEALTTAAANAGCRITIKRLVAGPTDKTSLLGEEFNVLKRDPTSDPPSVYKLRIECDVVADPPRSSRGARDRVHWHEYADRGNPDILSWLSTAPARVTKYVNQDLQKYLEPSLKRHKLPVSTDRTDRMVSWFGAQASKLSSMRLKVDYLGTDTDLGGFNPSIISRANGRSARDLKARPFLCEMIPSKGKIIFEMRHSNGASKTPTSTAALASDPDVGEISDAH